MIEEIIQIFRSLEFNWIIEISAVCFGIIYIVLAAKENIWCWPASAISVCLYAYIFYNQPFYAQAGLQIFYLTMSIYGYFMWKKVDSEKIKKWSEIKHIIIICFGLILTLVIEFYLREYVENSKNPGIDALTTVFSVFATYMVVKKVLESWLYWIVIDAVLVYLCYSTGLYITSFLYVSYIIIAIFGYFSWIKKMKVND